jgi:hypothetical protein
MPEIRDILEGESRSVDLEPGDFERLLRHRERLQRARRIRGGVAGLIVMLTTGLLLARLLSGASDGVVPAGPASPTMSATPSTPASSTGDEISFGPFGASPSVTVLAAQPDGWVDDSDFGALSGPEPGSQSPPDGVGMLFFSTDSLYRDPCHWDWSGTGTNEKGGDVKVGPTVEDLVAAIGKNTFYTSTAPTPVTVDGYAGEEIEIQLPDKSFTGCDVEPGDTTGHAYPFPIPVYAQGPANIWHLFVLDADGTRVVAAILSYPETSKAHLDTARTVIETMDIQV